MAGIHRRGRSTFILILLLIGLGFSIAYQTSLQPVIDPVMQRLLGGN
jgi:hypothetical protein